MKQEVVKCPGCGANVDILEGKEVQFCQYCGTKILLKEEEAPDNSVDLFGIGKAVKGVSSVANTYIQVKDREKQRLHEKEMEEERHTKFKISDNAVILAIVLLLAFAFLAGFFIED